MRNRGVQNDKLVDDEVLHRIVRPDDRHTVSISEVHSAPLVQLTHTLVMVVLTL